MTPNIVLIHVKEFIMNDTDFIGIDVAKGKFDAEKNKFFSKELLIKHDEKYMPPEVEKSLKK